MSCNKGCKCGRRRRCAIAQNSFVAGANGCSSFNNVLVKCGFRDHCCGSRGCRREHDHHDHR